MDSDQSYRKWHRAPAVPRKLSEINPETDIRVRITGTVTSISPVGIVINDGDETEIMAEQNIISKVKQGDFVRVFARVLPLETGYELRAELVQNISNLDKELWERVFQKK